MTVQFAIFDNVDSFSRFQSRKLFLDTILTFTLLKEVCVESAIHDGLNDVLRPARL